MAILRILMVHWQLFEFVAPTEGLEPPTGPLGGGYSIQLNYVGVCRR